ncbi:hypothetical protein OAT01_14120 [Pseudomonadales bacterium]|nr:hypothetical protein [Pseudomonadales bacterium]
MLQTFSNPIESGRIGKSLIAAPSGECGQGKDQKGQPSGDGSRRWNGYSRAFGLHVEGKQETPKQVDLSAGGGGEGKSERRVSRDVQREEASGCHGLSVRTQR